jgi:hypothetical protein
MDKKQRIVLIGTGSVAVKTRLLPTIEALNAGGYDVTVMLTPAVENYKWVSFEQVEAATGHKVLTEADDEATKKKALYLPDAILIIATADFLSQLAHKVSTLARQILAAQKGGSKLILVPAMNNWMWGNPKTQRNCDALRKRGVFLGPIFGRMACKDEGFGHVIAVEDLVAGVQAVLEGKKAHFTYAYYETAREEGRNPAPIRPAEDNARILVALGGGNLGWANLETFIGEISRTGLAADYVLDQNLAGYRDALQKATGRTVVSDYFQVLEDGLEHILLSKGSRCIFIPSLDDKTARALAHGEAGTLFLAACLAASVPIVTTREALLDVSPDLALRLEEDGLIVIDNIGQLAQFDPPAPSLASAPH